MGKVKRKKYGIRLHIKNDKDILAKLDEVDSKAGYIKELIKRDILARLDEVESKAGHIKDLISNEEED